MATNPSSILQLPLDAMSSAAVKLLDARDLIVSVPDDYEARLAQVICESEVIGIQRLLTLGRKGTQLRVEWGASIAAKAAVSPSIYPMLAVLMLLDGAEHWVIDASGKASPFSLESSRKLVIRAKFMKDMFSDSEIVTCADNIGSSMPLDLYDTKTGKLRSREDFETLIMDAMGAQLMGAVSRESRYEYLNALGVIVAELFENTHMHARFDLLGANFTRNSIRGLMFKRTYIMVPSPKNASIGTSLMRVDCAEISVFDSGLGYYSSYTRKPLEPDVTLQDEWKVLHNCLERHYYSDLNDKRAGHRAMGLYEVLRAIQSLQGRIEFRTGRLHAYRTFLPGDLQAQMQPASSLSHKAWPKPRLLDVEKKYLAMPSMSEELVGSSVRLIFPLRTA